MDEIQRMKLINYQPSFRIQTKTKPRQVVSQIEQAFPKWDPHPKTLIARPSTSYILGFNLCRRRLWFEL